MSETFVCQRAQADPLRIRRLQKDLRKFSELDQWAELFFTLSHPLRLKIAFLLWREEELCVCDLSDVLEESVSGVSHQLRRMRQAGLLRRRREAQTIYYSLNWERLNKIGGFIFEEKEAA